MQFFLNREYISCCYQRFSLTLRKDKSQNKRNLTNVGKNIALSVTYLCDVKTKQ